MNLVGSHKPEHSSCTWTLILQNTGQHCTSVSLCMYYYNRLYKRYQCKTLDEKSYYFTTFWTEFDRFQFTIMLFGIDVAADVFEENLDTIFGNLFQVSVKGLTVRLNFMLKFIGKTNQLLILLFLIIPCVSDRNLFILAFILLNLIQKWPSSKIDHLPHLRNHLLYRDYPGSTVCAYFFCFYSCPLLALLMWCMDQCISLYNSLLSSQALSCFQCLVTYPNIWITF